MAVPSWEGVRWSYDAGQPVHLPWHAPVWQAGDDGVDFVPGLPRRQLAFWDQVILRDHRERETFLSFLRDGVGVFDMLLPEFRGPSVDQPFNRGRFRGAVFSNRIPPAFRDFVDSEISSLLRLGCVARWDDVRGPDDPVVPLLQMSLSVEESKPRLIYDARPLNACIRDFPFSMDTVARVAQVASPDCFMTSLDDKSAFHHILLRPSSWPLFGFKYAGVPYCWRVLPFGFCASPWVYHTLSEAKASFLRSLSIPALAYLDDSFLCNFRLTHGRPPQEQWLAACHATYLAMLVAYFSGSFLSVHKCDMRPVKLLKYLGILCDSSTATFRIPREKLDKMHRRIHRALDARSISFVTLRSVTGQAASMSVAIPPASLFTQAMFSGVASLERSGMPAIDLASDAFADLLGELRWWCALEITSHEGPWQVARHFLARITRGASDASGFAFGGVVDAPEGPFEVGGVLPPEWRQRHINVKEMYALHQTLFQFCSQHPEVLRRAQVIMDVDSQAVQGAFNRGRSRSREMHDLLILLFDLQVRHQFRLSLKWVPTAENARADAISRPSREAVIQLSATAFMALWDELGPFNIDLMACEASAHVSPLTGVQLPFFSHYRCPRSAGVDVFAQNVAVLPGSSAPAFGFCFPPPIMAGHVVQHLAECRAHAVVVVPDLKPYWFPVVRHASVRSVQVAPVNARDAFLWPSPRGLRPWRYPRWAMVAYELDFRVHA